MTILQNFRDGYRVGTVWREFWRSLRRLIDHIACLTAVIMVAISYHDGRLDQATFYAVIALWFMRDYP